MLLRMRGGMMGGPGDICPGLCTGSYGRCLGLDRAPIPWLPEAALAGLDKYGDVRTELKGKLTLR